MTLGELKHLNPREVWPDEAQYFTLCEVYYDFFRASNQDTAEAAISDLLGLGIEDRTDMDSEFWRDVGGLKAVHRRFLSRTVAR